MWGGWGAVETNPWGGDRAPRPAPRATGSQDQLASGSGRTWNLMRPGLAPAIKIAIKRTHADALAPHADARIARRIHVRDRPPGERIASLGATRDSGC